jgi:hypothetical protein
MKFGTQTKENSLSEKNHTATGPESISKTARSARLTTSTKKLLVSTTVEKQQILIAKNGKAL